MAGDLIGPPWGALIVEAEDIFNPLARIEALDRDRAREGPLDGILGVALDMDVRAD
jgi:hypothetical protein